MTVILASASPRRMELLQQAGIPFVAWPADCDEHVPPGTVPPKAVRLLARRKAETVWQRLNQGGVPPPVDAQSVPCPTKWPPRECAVIGADTLVALGSRALGKPATTAEAAEMLRALSGRRHCVFTGVCVLRLGKRPLVYSVKTDVWFDPIPPDALARLAETGLDFAGAYAIQGQAGAFVRRVAGDVDNVIGLPLGKLRRILRK